MMDAKVIVGKNTIDVSRVTNVNANAVAGGGESTYTLSYDGAYDDQDMTGNPLAAGKVGDYSKDMPKDARSNIGNRQTYTERELVESGFFEKYAEVFPNRKQVGPAKASRASEEKPA